MKTFLPLSLFILIFQSCTTVDERVVPMLGIYTGHIVGVAGPFDIVVAADGADNISIDAPFDGQEYQVVNADMDQLDEWVTDIDIYRQSLGPEIEISGDGFADGASLQLNYSLTINGSKHRFKMIGTKVR